MNLLRLGLGWIVPALAIVFAMSVISGRTQSRMTVVRNLLITCGAFWLSLWIRAALDPLFGKLNEGIIYGDSQMAAVALGVALSLANAVAAIIAAGIVIVSVDSPRPLRWAACIALFYGIFEIPRWTGITLTEWLRVMRGSQLLFPSVACLLGLATIAYFRREKSALQ